MFLFIFCAKGQSEGRLMDNEEIFTIRFRLLSWDQSVSNLFYKQGDEKISVLASRSTPSVWYEYKGPAPLIFWREGKVRKESGDQSLIQEPAARFVPERSGDWLFLLSELSSADLKTGDDFRILAIPDPGDRIFPGVRMINFGPREIAFQINGEIVRIGPGEIGFLQPGPRSDGSITIRVAARDSVSWEPVFSTVFESHPDRRIALFVVEESGRTQFRRFSEPAF